MLDLRIFNLWALVYEVLSPLLILVVTRLLIQNQNTMSKISKSFQVFLTRKGFVQDEQLVNVTFERYLLIACVLQPKLLGHNEVMVLLSQSEDFLQPRI